MQPTACIMLHGILQRSGTNLLNQILLLNPTVVQPVVKVRENWFIHHSEVLYSYSERLFQTWSSPKWSGEDFSKTEFYSMIGNALVTYIAKKIPDISNRILLSKTPSVQHLHRNFEMFPKSKVIIIVRDPRDIATSALKTWNRPFKQSIKDWNIAARAISDFERQTPPEYYFLLRFEDLIYEKEKWVKKCLQFLGLKETSFPWDALNELPIFGSSEEASWQVKANRKSFKPVGRWRSLPDDQKQNFSLIDSSALDYFGYSGDKEYHTLPIREERLAKKISYSIDSLQPNLLKERPFDRVAKMRKAMGLITEALLGEAVANYIRKKTS